MIGKIVNIDGWDQDKKFEILDKIFVAHNGASITKYLCVSTNNKEKRFAFVVDPSCIYFLPTPKEVVL